MNPKIKYAGLVWYRREDYEKLKSVFSDSHVLPETFDKWLQRAENGFSDATSKGHTVVKVYIDPETFPAWCRQRSLDVNAKARVAFANDFIARKYRGQNV